MAMIQEMKWSVVECARVCVYFITTNNNKRTGVLGDYLISR